MLLVAEWLTRSINPPKLSVCVLAILPLCLLFMYNVNCMASCDMTVEDWILVLHVGSD